MSAYATEKRLRYLADANDKVSLAVKQTLESSTTEWAKSLKQVSHSLHSLNDKLRHTSQSTRIINEELADFSVELLNDASFGGLLSCFTQDHELARAESVEGNSSKQIGPTNEGFKRWQVLSNSKEFRHGLYEQYLTLDDFPLSSVIRVDIPRTFPSVEPFSDPESGIHKCLENILHAYSLHDPIVGYVQGMNILCGFLLLRSPKYSDEVSTFWLFCRMLQSAKYGLRRLFLPGMERLLVLAYQLDHLVALCLPRINEHFRRLNVKTLVWFTPWALTLFACNMPHSMLSKVWDRFFQNGLVALLSTTIGILSCAEQRLLLHNHEECLTCLKKTIWDEVVDINQIFAVADGIGLSQRDCDRLEVEYFVRNQ